MNFITFLKSMRVETGDVSTLVVLIIVIGYIALY